MLVRGAMEYDLRLVRGEYLRNAASIADIRDDRHDIRPDPTMPQLAIDLKKDVFRAIKQNQFSRAEAHRLAADFRTDAPPGASDHHDLAGDETLKLGRIEIDGLSTEEFG